MGLESHFSRYAGKEDARQEYQVQRRAREEEEGIDWLAHLEIIPPDHDHSRRDTRADTLHRLYVIERSHNPVGPDTFRCHLSRSIHGGRRGMASKCRISSVPASFSVPIATLSSDRDALFQLPCYSTAIFSVSTWSPSTLFSSTLSPTPSRPALTTAVSFRASSASCRMRNRFGAKTMASIAKRSLFRQCFAKLTN